MRYLVLLVLHGFTMAYACAQKPVQTISGYVFDAVLQHPVEGAEVYLQNTDPVKGTVAGSDGAFSLEEVPVGRYTIMVKHIGFRFFAEEIVVEAGKPLRIDIALVPSFSELEPVTIVEKPFISDPNTVGKRKITIEQTRRFAANYLDPARVMITFPGVAPQNDQNNNLIINGKSPNGMLWRVEGLDVLNPNHLSNAGTLSDRPTSAGGGVNMLNAQILGETRFITAPLSSAYGNALSGVMEMNFRPGNMQEVHYTTQASLIGLDLAAEGPLEKDRSSFLANYRYSTVGLLSAMGVDFGGEEINFQDLSFHLAFDQQKGGQLSVFGYGGNSSNEFSGVDNPEDWEIDKDSTQINYYSASAAIGVNEILALGPVSSINVGAAFSVLDNERTSASLARNGASTPAENYELQQWLLSAKAEYATTLSTSAQLTLGFMVDYQNNKILAMEMYTERGTLLDGEGEGALLQPYFGLHIQLAKKLMAEAGLRYMYYSFNQTSSWLPSVLLNYSLSVKDIFNINYSTQSQLQLPEVYFSNQNDKLEMNKLYHFGVGYNRVFNSGLLTSQLFYEHLYDIPVEGSIESSFSVVNQLNDFVTVPLSSKGKGDIYGIDLAYEHPMANGIYYIASGSLFEANYEGSDGVERDSRFNNNYTFSFTAGKELTREKEGGQLKITGLNGRVFYAGGLHNTPVDIAGSLAAQRTVYVEDRAFSERLGDYFRLDFRLSFRKEKPGYTRVLALDIQNLLSIENDGFEYYDFRKREVTMKKQLGIIPILVYRIEF